jgi:peptide/nickel transport system substrate-binding protein
MTALLLLSLAFSRPATASSTDTLVVCDDVQDPLTLDPQKEFSEKSLTLLQQVYEGLVRFDAEGRIVPALAVSWERLGPLRMRFKLRRGVRFQDGEPFDARAVVYTMERYLDPAAHLPGRGFLGPIEKAEAVDPETVDVVTASPDGLLLNRLAWQFLIMAPDFVKNNGEQALESRSAGTGPFKLEGWERGRQIALVRNEDHWRKPLPLLKRLTFRFIPAERQVEALLKGEVDMLTELPGAASLRLRDKGIRIIQRPTFYTYAATFNTSRPPLSDVRVRRALNLAIDRKELIRYDVRGSGERLATLTMPGEEGHDASLGPYRFDPDAARALLKEAGYLDGIRLKVNVKAQAARTFAIVKSMLERVGVKVDAVELSETDIVGGKKVQDWDMGFAECPDPMFHAYFIQAIFLYSKSPYTLMKDAEYDRQLESAASTLDPIERATAFKILDRYVYDNALSLFTYQRLRTQGTAPGVDFTPSLSGMSYFDRAGWSAR